ncbi:chromate efflux transporter [Novispirillum sp. DQ9]|uniref:chromate efflux transporter n=1 Tax=Novispirillum sp. DQ9 TaxID=3398612 RepID=UPI003C7E2B0F
MVWLQIFAAFARLGVTSFGGPVAHIGYFRDEFVTRRGWLDDRAYADLVALCQVLPGPASSQVGMALGLHRGGWPGLLAAWVAFTLPSAVLLAAAAVGLAGLGGGAWQDGLVHGLKAAAVAVVAQAVWGMARSLWPGRRHAAVGLLAAVAALLVPGAWGQVAVIVLGGLAGWRLLPEAAVEAAPTLALPHGRRTGAVLLALFVVLLVGLPLVAGGPDTASGLAAAFYRAGALVFGGGHVVLPLLDSAVVPTGVVPADTFLAGYGLAQAVPGPLFTFAAYLGAAAGLPDAPWAWAALALGAIFLPAFLLVAGALPFWSILAGVHGARAALAGVNAAVVGLLLAALYDPVFTAAVHGPADFALVLTAGLLLMVARWPAWAAVAAIGAVGAGFAVLA